MSWTLHPVVRISRLRQLARGRRLNRWPSDVPAPATTSTP